MQQNMGNVDRAVRGLLAVTAGALGTANKDKPIGKVFLGLAGLLGVTSATGYCPAYGPMGIDTRDKNTSL